MKNDEELFWIEQEYSLYQQIIYSKFILNKEEYELCNIWDPKFTKLYIINIGDDLWFNTKINKKVI